MALITVERCPCLRWRTEHLPSTIRGAKEKHVPVFEVKDNKVHVTVGTEEHPMTKEHYIQWISIHTDSGNQRKELRPGN